MTPDVPDGGLRHRQQRYDQGWRSELAAGRERPGNVQTNLEFLTQTGILKPTDRILEVGCGMGSMVAELTKQGFDVVGIDISREVVGYGLKKYGNIRLEVGVAEHLPYEDGAFDVVLSFDLFEHIAEVDRHVREVLRVLKDGAFYLFQTPNKYSSAVSETLLHKSLKWRWAHPSLHTPGQLTRRLTRHGFAVRFVKMNPINEYTLTKLRRFGPVGGILRHIDFRKLPLSLQTNLYVVARKLALHR